MIGRIADWDKRYAVESKAGRAIDIDQDIIINQKTMEVTDGGIFRKEFGFDLNGTELKEYTCDCGKSHSGHSVKHICEVCGSEIRPHFGRDILRYGWVSFGDFYIIKPNLYQMIKSVIGEKTLIKMLNYERLVNGAGMVISYEEKFGLITDKMEIYNNIGMVEFYKNFVKIISYFGGIRGKRNEKLRIKAEFLIEEYNKNNVFASHYPIISALLRPAYISGGKSKEKKTLAFVGVNKNYVRILNMNKSLQRHNRKASGLSSFADKGLTIIYAIQEEINAVYKLFLQTNLSGKSKDIRGKMLGKRMYFSSRMVIISTSGKYNRIDGVVMSYKGFLECYKPLIINCMMSGRGHKSFANMTVAEALTYLKRVETSNELDVNIYAIMMWLVNNYDNGSGLPVLVNRNPSMDEGSIQQLIIVDVSSDVTNKTLAVPLTSCTSWNADFDGDVLNVYLLIEKNIIAAFSAFNPKRCVIDKSGGSYLNTKFSLSKDRNTSLFSFIDSGKNNPTAKDYDNTIKRKRVLLPHELENVVFTNTLKKKDFDGEYIKPEVVLEKLGSTFRNRFNVKHTV